MPAPVRYGPEMRILVVGAGLGGLSLAAHLRGRGFEPDVIERGPTVPRGPRSSDCTLVFPPTAGVLKGLGMFREFLERATPLDALTVLEGSGREVRTLPLGRFMEPYGGAYIGTRADVVGEMAKLVGPARSEVDVQSMVQGRDGVEVTLTDGTTAEYDIVAGADGLDSHVRGLSLGPNIGTFWFGRMWTFTLEPPLELPGVLTEVWAPGHFVGMYRAGGVTHCALAAPATADDQDPPSERRERLSKLFGKLGGPVPHVLERLPEAEQIRTELLYDLRLDRWSSGRVVLIGDAAHACIPVVGLGGGAAIVSGAVLSSELARADSTHLDAAFDFYAKRRKHRIAEVQDRTRERFSILSVRHRFVAWTRDEIMRATSDKRLLEGWEQILGQPL